LIMMACECYCAGSCDPCAPIRRRLQCFGPRQLHPPSNDISAFGNAVVSAERSSL